MNKTTQSFLMSHRQKCDGHFIPLVSAHLQGPGFETNSVVTELICDRCLVRIKTGIEKEFHHG